MGRVIMGFMDVWRIGITLVLSSVLVCVLSTKGLAGRQGTEDFFSRNGNSKISNSQELDELMEQLWIKCGLHLMQIKESIQNKGLLLLDKRTTDSTKINLQKLMAALSPQMKHILLDCLMKNDFPFQVTGGETGSESWYAWRRRLVDDSREAASLSPVVESRNASHAPVSAIDDLFPPEALDSDSDDYPPRTESSYSNDADSSTSQDVNPIRRSKEHNDINGENVIILSIVITAAGTLVFSICLFWCFLKCRRKKDTIFGDGHKDVSPLLTLSLSDFSVGSSQKSFGLGNLVGKEKFEDSCHKAEPTSHERSSFWLDVNQMSLESSTVKSSTPETPSLGTIAIVTDMQVPPPPPLSRPPLPPPPPPPKTTSPCAAAPPPLQPAPPPPASTRIKLVPLSPSLSPPKAGPPPPPSPLSRSCGPKPPPPLAPNYPGASGADAKYGPLKPKLKPFFWDKVLANPNHSMVWHEISSGSFQFNEEMIETLFGYNSTDKTNPMHKKQPSLGDPSSQFVRILEPKKAQNLSILLKALDVTTGGVCDALLEGIELPPELLQTLLKMAPSAEEELKLRVYTGELSQLGPAELFSKGVVDIPFAYKRMDALLYMGTLQEEVSGLKDSFATIEVACKELRSCRLFLKLLEAVLKTGNRMNDGTYRGGAQAFKLDTLLKLSDVKGTDGKTTLLHFVVREIILSEGRRAVRMANLSSSSFSSINSDDLTEESQSPTLREHFHSLGLQVVSGLGGELENVKKAAVLDADTITGTVMRLGNGLTRMKEFLKTDMIGVEEDRGFRNRLTSFVEGAEGEVMWLLDEEKRVRGLVRSTTVYFYGSAGEKDDGLHLFTVVRGFVAMVDKVCKEIKELAAKKKEVAKKGPTTTNLQSVLDSRRQMLFPAIRDKRVNKDSDSSSSDDDKS